MKRLITILVATSLGLTAATAQDDSQDTSKRKKKQQQQEQQAQPQQSQSQAQPQRARQGQRQQTQESRASRQEQRRQQSAQPATAEGGRSEQRRARREQARQEQPNVNANAQTEERNNRREEGNRRGTAAGEAETSQTATGRSTNERRNARSGEQRDRQDNAGEAGASQAATGQTNANAAAQSNERRNARANTGKGKKPDVQTVQRVKEQHANFRAQAKPEKVPSVKFQQNFRITNAEHWQGPQYIAFRQYRPVWHDRSWWHSHFNTIVLIGGGYYYWDNGYWYPAWGYDPSASYYVYNGPIYTGSQSLPPDQVIANVQAVLQEMGYYRGEVDGLLGPLTREALTAYQADNGLYTTAAIDQPTLDSLGLQS
jgi:hypothetical protein